MRFSVQKVALLSGVAGGVVSLLCAVFVALFPEFSMSLFSWAVHMNVEEALAVRVTAGGAIAGAIEVFIYAYIAGWIAAKILNASVEKGAAQG